jgi:hypothetical protein
MRDHGKMEPMGENPARPVSVYRHFGVTPEARDLGSANDISFQPGGAEEKNSGIVYIADFQRIRRQNRPYYMGTAKIDRRAAVDAYSRRTRIRACIVGMAVAGVGLGFLALIMTNL